MASGYPLHEPILNSDDELEPALSTSVQEQVVQPEQLVPQSEDATSAKAENPSDEQLPHVELENAWRNFSQNHRKVRVSSLAAFKNSPGFK